MDMLIVKDHETLKRIPQEVIRIMRLVLVGPEYPEEGKRVYRVMKSNSFMSVTITDDGLARYLKEKP